MDPKQALKVLSQVDEKAIVDLACELIKIPSFKPEREGAARHRISGTIPEIA